MGLKFQHSHQESVEVLGSNLNASAPSEEQIRIDIPALLLRLASLLPGGSERERLAR